MDNCVEIAYGGNSRQRLVSGDGHTGESLPPLGAGVKRLTFSAEPTRRIPGCAKRKIPARRGMKLMESLPAYLTSACPRSPAQG